MPTLEPKYAPEYYSARQNPFNSPSYFPELICCQAQICVLFSVLLKSILLKIGYNSKSTKRASLSELLVVQCFRVEMRRVAELSRLLLPAAGRGASEKRLAVGFCLGSGLFKSYNSD